MCGADRVAMAALAIDVGTGMFRDRVVASQENRTVGSEPAEDRRHISVCQVRE
jgi:hypothetical protein